MPPKAAAVHCPDGSCELLGAVQEARRTPRRARQKQLLGGRVRARPGPVRYRRFVRERILADTLHQRGNRVVTNKRFDWSYACSSSRIVENCVVRHSLLPGSWGLTDMSKIIVVGTAVLLFVSVGIGLWDVVRGLSSLDTGVALIFVISAVLNSWGG